MPSSKQNCISKWFKKNGMEKNKKIEEEPLPSLLENE